MVSGIFGVDHPPKKRLVLSARPLVGEEERIPHLLGCLHVIKFRKEFNGNIIMLTGKLLRPPVCGVVGRIGVKLPVKECLHWGREILEALAKGGKRKKENEKKQQI